MKILHVLKSPPDGLTDQLIALVSEGEEKEVFKLYEEGADYGALIDKVFAHDKVISWW
jgi:hypothetical protein